MSENMAHTSDQINQAVNFILKLRPSYATILEFYGKIFSAQEDMKPHLNINPVIISKDLIQIKARDKFPLISISEFGIDQQASKELFKRICSISADSNDYLADSARKLIRLLDFDQIDFEALVSSLLNNDDSFFEKNSTQFDLDKKVLAFITYNSIKPCLSACADQLASYLDKNVEWGKGYCPICGSAPGISMFQGQGERFLYCSFCWHKWTAKRIYCPFCDNRDTESLQYLFSEDEKEYRVDICDKCNKYIKTVDTRATERLIYPPLEQVATLHLDIKAKEIGLLSGVELFL